MDTTLIIQSLQQMPEIIENYTVVFFFAAARAVWAMYGQLILGVLMVATLIIVLQLCIGGKNIMPSYVNSFVGKIMRWFFIVAIFSAAYTILGPQVIDETWFAIFGVIATTVTGLFLIKINFWQYTPLPYRKKHYFHKRANRGI